MKREGYVIKDLDRYLLSLSGSDSDRAIDVNAPSQIGKCLRERYYARIGEEPDNITIEPRTRRIFDNGTKTHERLQEYLKEQGMLLADEIPVISDEYNIQGHTDGILKLSAVELAILEIKSIKDRNFNELRCAKDEHIKQGLSYIFCIENRRKYLRETYESLEDFEAEAEKNSRYNYYASKYQHLKDGSKYTREEKIAFQCNLHNAIDTILVQTKIPITKAVFLYENKDNQELKEFCVSTKDPESSKILDEVLKECEYLNKCVEEGEIPNRCGTSKSCNECRWCNYKIACYN